MRFRALAAALIVLTVALALEADRHEVSAESVDTSTYGPIARMAVAALGQQQGECFIFVQHVVSRAVGITIGPDYRLGYLQAGAAEIPMAAARNGDIIQLENDANTAPTADYPGLHTAIILASRGSGVFQVVDSNANYDGIVRIRDFDPAADAARYSNISFHIYRLPDAPGAAAPPAASQPSNQTAPLTAGAPALIAADGDCLRVRSAPTLTAGVLGCLPTGSRVSVVRIGDAVDSYRWIQITAGSLNGWAADRYLQGIAASSAVAPPAAPTPPPTTGKIVFGTIPDAGVGLVVWGGGSEQQLVTAANCNGPTPAFWISDGGTFIPFVSGATIAAVNAAWHARFPDSIPAGTALLGRCAGTATPTAPADAATPAASTPPAADSAKQPPPAPPAAPPATEVPPATSSPSHYTVVEGDTLSAIAERMHPPTTNVGDYLDQLYTLNGLDGDSLLSLGQVLRLPDGAPAPSAAATPPSSAPPTRYTVVEGDTLSAIAERMHRPTMTVGDYLEQLYALNGLDEGSVLSLGQVLQLPA